MSSILLRACIAGLLALGGCATHSRVSDELAAGAAAKDTGIVLLMIGTRDARCHIVSAGFAVREGNDYRVVGGVSLTRKAKDVPVGETALPAGEYHLVNYSCRRTTTSGHSDGALMGERTGYVTYGRSYGSFTVQAGEVVNLGFLKVSGERTQPGILYSTMDASFEITDWPLHDLERFQRERPALYARMKTRLLALAKS